MSFLDRVDRHIDANAIVFERCLETAARIAGKAGMPQFYGPEQDPSTQDGVIMAAAVMCQSVLRNFKLDEIEIDSLIAGYTAEKAEQKRLALEERDRQLAQVELQRQNVGPHAG